MAVHERRTRTHTPLPPSCDDQKCFHIAKNGGGGAKSPSVEKHGGTEKSWTWMWHKKSSWTPQASQELEWPFWVVKVGLRWWGLYSPIRSSHWTWALGGMALGEVALCDWSNKSFIEGGPEPYQCSQHVLLQNCSFASQHLPLSDKTPENWGHVSFGSVSSKHSTTWEYWLSEIMKWEDNCGYLGSYKLKYYIKGFNMHYLKTWETPKRLIHIYIIMLNYEYLFGSNKSHYQLIDNKF